jgi:hypothetical protein
MRTTADIQATLASHPFPDNPWVKVTDDGVRIQAGYSETLQRMLRWVPGARWRPDLRAWLVPLAGVELVRSVLPEISRLAEAMHEERLAEAAAPPPTHTAPAAPATLDGADPAVATSQQSRRWFRDAARLLYGSDWQRETAHALGRDEAALACWLVGEGVAEAPEAVLLQEMLTLMHRRAQAIQAAAAELAQGLRTRGEL